MSLKVRRVESKSDLKNFIYFPWKIYQGDKNWVPPLIFDMKRKLDPKENPYFEHARAQYFLAERNGEIVGRITAQVDDHYYQHWGEKVGQWGFFESIDDQEVASALFDSARSWLKEQGQVKMQGPFNFTINDECGLLIDGFDSPPMMLMTYNPAYYQKLCEGYGMRKAIDLLAYKTTADTEPDPAIVNFANLLKQKHEIKIQNMNWKNFDQQMDWFVEIYNSAWEKNWGMVPLTEKELRYHTAELRLLAWRFPELNFFALVNNKPIGMSITIPNLNEVLIKCNGRLLTPRIIELLTHKFESCRVFALGVKEEYRRMGVGAVFYVETLNSARRTGFKWGEMSWILETNAPMRRAIERMGGYVYKTYRIYEIEV